MITKNSTYPQGNAWLSIHLSTLFYRHFDKDKSGKLDHVEFKSCLRALGYDLPMVAEGEQDHEFQAILDSVCELKT